MSRLDSLGDYNEEQGEWFHQDSEEMENTNQGSKYECNVNLMADYLLQAKHTANRGQR